MKDFFKKLFAKLVGKNDFLLAIAFDFLKDEIQKIKFKPLRLEILSNIEPLENIIAIFTDADPDNEGQLKEWWEENREKVVDNKILSAAEFISAMKGIDPHYKGVIIQQLVTLAAQQLFKDPTGEDAGDFIQTELERIAAISAESPGTTVAFSSLLPVNVPEPKPRAARTTKPKAATAKAAATPPAEGETAPPKKTAGRPKKKGRGRPPKTA